MRGGLAVQSRIISSGRITDEDVAERLGLHAAAPLVRVERLRLAGEEPFAMETCYLSAGEFPGLSRRNYKVVRYLAPWSVSTGSKLPTRMKRFLLSPPIGHLRNCFM